MASVLLVLLVATLAVSADASRHGQLQEQKPSYPSSSSSSCNEHAERLQVWNKCCNELGKCGKSICSAVKDVADSIPFLQGLCGDYACSPPMWNDETGKDATSKLECKAEGCKAAVEVLKKMDCFCKVAHLKRD